METRELGRAGLKVAAIGLGCMGMSEFYGPRDQTESIATIHRALDLGVTLLDTADICGPFTNEVLVGRAVRGRRESVVLAAKNLDLVKRIREIAAEKGCTTAQLALAWVLAQGGDVVPIPGTKRRKYLEENLPAVRLTLTAADLARIDRVAPKGAAHGQRYPEAAMGLVNG